MFFFAASQYISITHHMAMDVHMGQPYPKGFIFSLYTPGRKERKIGILKREELRRCTIGNIAHGF